MSRNFDYPMPLEGRMAKSYLWAIEKDARELREQLQDNDNLPGWVQAKIVTAQDRISTVNRYLGHKIGRATGTIAEKNPASKPLWHYVLGSVVILAGTEYAYRAFSR